ncbi:MAG: TIGR04283 family arsenosugar biosynthesis glycosyltransferase, partial [Bryobacteraceae bacterium]
NEAGTIGETLNLVSRMDGPVEVLVVDGGSDDDTVSIVRAHGVRVITAKRGRGPQMHAGANAASGIAIWFLHADTHPPRDGALRILEAMRDPSIAGGNFSLRFGGVRKAARFMSWFYAQFRKFGLFYGDSAIFVRREFYERSGGYPALPLFEDVELIRRLRKLGRMVHIPATVECSSRRFESGRSFTVALGRAILLQVLYWMGVPPVTLYRFYPQIRK